MKNGSCSEYPWHSSSEYQELDPDSGNTCSWRHRQSDLATSTWRTSPKGDWSSCRLARPITTIAIGMSFCSTHRPSYRSFKGST